MTKNLKKEELHNLIVSLDQKAQEYIKLCTEFDILKSQKNTNLKNQYCVELQERFTKNLEDIIKITEDIKKFKYKTSNN